MLKYCLEIFKKELDEYGDNLILDNYIPADGTYIIVHPKDDSYEIKDVINIKQDKKTKEIDKSDKYFKDICNYDYNSKLIDMNKPIDGKKIIQSNNYLSFFIKKESLTNGKLTNEIIDNYYSVLSNPFLKYTKKKGKSIYESIESEIGKVDTDKLENIKKWIKDNIFNLGLEIKGKDYLKVFFDYPLEDYKREGKRYIVPNIYNSNDFNITIHDDIYGLPNDNMGLNGKKPYLENKTRSTKVPYLIDSKEVLLQKKFFDYLMTLALAGKVNVYIGDKIIGYKNGELPDRDFTGMFLRIKKGKELEIHDCDSVIGYKPNLPKKFVFKNVLELNLEKMSIQKYGDCLTFKDMQTVLNEVLFSKRLITNYFTKPEDLSINNGCIRINILLARENLFNWFYKGIDNGVFPIIDKVSLNLIKGSIENGYIQKAGHQFNLRWSLMYCFKGGKDMADIVYDIKAVLRKKINNNITDKLDNDDEYYFAVGQMVGYLLSKNKGKKKPHSLASPFTNAKSNEAVKENLRKMFNKYSYDDSINGKRFNNLYAMIVGYVPEGKVNQDMIIAGYLNNNLIYEKEEN